MTALLDNVRSVFTSRRAAAEKTYRRLVTDPDGAKAKDAESLADALRELGKRPENFAADVAAIAQARHIESVMPDPADVTGKREAAEEWTLRQARALADSRNRRRALIAEFGRETSRERQLAADLTANAPRAEAEALERRAADLRGQLDGLRRSHPLAFE